MGEDVTDWIDDEDTESDDDTADSEEEWHQVKDEEAAWAELDIATIQSRVDRVTLEWCHYQTITNTKPPQPPKSRPPLTSPQHHPKCVYNLELSQ